MFTRRANTVLRRHGGDHRIDLLGRSGDDGLAWRDVARHADAGIVGDRRLGRLGIQLQPAPPRPGRPAATSTGERMAITRSPSATLSAPATTAAVTSPIEWPITASGVTAVVRHSSVNASCSPMMTGCTRASPLTVSPVGDHLLQREADLLANTGSSSSIASANAASADSYFRPAQCEP